MKRQKALVIGAGFAGCMYAKVLRDSGWDVTVVESGGYAGGGVRTFFYAGHPYTYGPRHFLSPYQEAFDYLNEIVPMRQLRKMNWSYQEAEDAFMSYPVHEEDIDRFSDAQAIKDELVHLEGQTTEARNFEEFWQAKIGRRLYERFVKEYNRKAWRLESNTDMDFGFEATVKMKPLESGDRYEYRDWFNSYPLAHDGYNAFFDYALEGCTVQLGVKITDFGIREKRATLSSGSHLHYDLLISSTSPDVLMNFEGGRLEYVGRRFIKFVLPVEHAFPQDVYFCYYPSASAEMTRIVEYKKFTQHKSPNTLLVMEIPAAEPRLYPTLKKTQVKLADQYLSELPNYVVSVGRMGRYRYVDIDDIIMDALEFRKSL